MEKFQHSTAQTHAGQGPTDIEAEGEFSVSFYQHESYTPSSDESLGNVVSRTAVKNLFACARGRQNPKGEEILSDFSKIMKMVIINAENICFPVDSMRVSIV